MNELGSLEKTYQVKLQAQMISLIAGIVFLGLGGLFFVLSLFTDFLVSENNPQSFIIFVAGVSLFAAIIGIVFIYKAFQLRNDNLCLYEKGFVLTEKNIVYPARWDEIESIYERVTQTIVNGFPTPPVHSFTIAKFNGDKFFLKPVLKDIRQIGERIKAETFTRQLPIIIKRFNNGETIPFGKFSINERFVCSENQETLPLQQFWKFVIKDGVVHIYSKENFKIWNSAKYDSIPNFPIFQHLLENFSKGVWLV